MIDEIFVADSLEEGPVPLYYQLQQIIKDKIENDLFEEGDKLPAERALADHFDINRRTVSKAIDNLVDEGLLVKKRGRGTFIAPKKIVSNVNWLNSFHDDVNFENKEVEIRIIEVKEIEPSHKVKKALGLDREGKVFNLMRLGLLNNEPISVHDSFLPVHLFPDFPLKIKESDSLYYLIEEFYERELTSGEEFLEVTTLTEYEAKLLKSKGGSPAFILQRVTYSSSNPVEYVKSILRGDRYKFKTKLKRR